MSYPNKSFIEDVIDLIKSLMNFCEYDIINQKGEIVIFVKAVAFLDQARPSKKKTRIAKLV